MDNLPLPTPTPGQPELSATSSTDSAPVKLLYVDPYFLPQVFPKIAAHLERACAESNGMMTVDFLVRNLDNKAMQLFVASDFSAALVTQIATYPTGQRYFVLVSMGANNFEHIEPLLEEVEKQAKALGCLGLEIYGRDGWTRKLPSYRRVTTILRKTFEIPTPLVQNEEAVNEFAT